MLIQRGTCLRLIGLDLIALSNLPDFNEFGLSFRLINLRIRSGISGCNLHQGYGSLRWLNAYSFVVLVS